MERMPESIEIISGKIYNIVRKYKIDPSELDSNGAIFYMNGNDGTDFDWKCNDRLCEFMVFHKNEMGFIKCLVDRNSKMTMYVFPHGELHPVETIECSCGFSARDLKDTMIRVADDKHLWDKSIYELFN